MIPLATTRHHIKFLIPPFSNPTLYFNCLIFDRYPLKENSELYSFCLLLQYEMVLTGRVQRTLGAHLAITGPVRISVFKNKKKEYLTDDFRSKQAVQLCIFTYKYNNPTWPDHNYSFPLLRPDFLSWILRSGYFLVEKCGILVEGTAADVKIEITCCPNKVVTENYKSQQEEELKLGTRQISINCCWRVSSVNFYRRLY